MFRSKPKIAMGDLKNVVRQWTEFLVNHDFEMRELELIEIVLVKMLDTTRRKMKGDHT